MLKSTLLHASRPLVGHVVPPTQQGCCRPVAWPSSWQPKHKHRLPLPHGVSSNIIQVLKDEVKYQKESYRPSTALDEEPPEPFELDLAPRTRAVCLTRTYKKENILVQLHLDKQEPLEFDENEEMEADMDLYAIVTFTVNIFKNDKVMTFECESDMEVVTIKHIELIAVDETLGEDNVYPPYTGPVFNELDDTLKQAFLDYLEDRGVTGELAAYLMSVAQDKSWNEYMNWLTGVKEFIAD